MKTQTIAIIAIITVGTLFGIGYATSTVISDTGITTNNLTVTGTCSGCGIGSGTFTTWTKSLNSTIAGTTGNYVTGLLTSIDGSVIVSSSNDRTSLVKLDGTVVIVNTSPSSFSNVGEIPYSQSIDGVYKTILTSTGINVYKNNSLLTTIGIKASDFLGSDLSTVSVSISADGKYISFAGEDTGGALERVVILTGS